ncbi:hypothetical protein ACLOJK_036713 [Asimina triloba]
MLLQDSMEIGRPLIWWATRSGGDGRMLWDAAGSRHQLVMGGRWIWAWRAEADLLQLDVTALLMGGGLAGVVEEGGGRSMDWSADGFGSHGYQTKMGKMGF